MGQIHDQVVKVVGANGAEEAAVTLRGSKGAVAVEILDENGNQINIGSGLVTETFDSVEVNYTDSTKAFISTAVFKNNGTAVATITVTYPSGTQEIYTKT